MRRSSARRPGRDHPRPLPALAGRGLPISEAAMTTRLTLALLLLACQSRPPAEAHIDAAGVFTARYAKSALSVWKVRGSAAGADCDVLLVETSVVMNESMVEALHYGAGRYGVVHGGVQRVYRDGAFRGVAYRDAAGH